MRTNQTVPIRDIRGEGPKAWVLGIIREYRRYPRSKTFVSIPKGLLFCTIRGSVWRVIRLVDFTFHRMLAAAVLSHAVVVTCASCFGITPYPPHAPIRSRFVGSRA